MKRLLFFILVFTFLFGVPFATTYYVSPTGNDGNTGLGTGNDEAWLTITKANDTLTAGDTVEILAGTYSTNDGGRVIYPDNNGTPGNQITYTNYSTDTVYIRGQVILAVINKNYITLDGLRFEEASQAAATMYRGIEIIAGKHHVIIQNCIIKNTVENRAGNAAIDGIKVRDGCEYCQILNNTISYIGKEETDNGNGDGINFHHNNDQCTSRYNLIEGNTLHHISHTPLSMRGNHNIWRDNTINNTWHRGGTMLGYKDSSTPERNVYDDNKIYDCGYSGFNSSWHNPGLRLSSGGNIIRRNRFYGNLGSGLYLRGTDGKFYSDDNRIYHNIMYGNGLDATSVGDTGIFLNEDTGSDTQDSNIFKNNINYNNEDNDGVDTYQDASTGDNTWTNNWNLLTGTDDPLFVDAPNDDFEIESHSGCVGTGGWLTLTNGTGSGSTTLIVDDASYFCDGHNITTGDTIQLQGQETTAVITSINYGTDTLTIDTGLTWADGIGVHLEYEGSYPDIGWYEVPLGGGADQVDFPNIYIDVDVGDGGVGSQADPYNEDSDINWTTGDDNSIFDYYNNTPIASVTINFKRGGEWREQMTVSGLGTAAYPIIIRAYGEGARPIFNGSDLKTVWGDEGGDVWKQTGGTTSEPVALYIDGTRGFKRDVVGNLADVNDWCWDSDDLYLKAESDPDGLSDPGVEATRRMGVKLEDKQYITIESLHLIKCNWQAIKIWDGATNIIIDDCEIGPTGYAGIACNATGMTNCTDIIIRYCDVHDCGVTGIELGPSAYDWIVEYNDVYDNCENEDEHEENGGGGIKIGGGSSNPDESGGHIVQYNNVYSNGASGQNMNGAGVWMDFADDAEPCIIRYNKSYSNETDGIVIENSENNEVYYNLCWSNVINGIYVVGVTSAQPSAGNKLYNNVCYDSGLNGIEMRGVGADSILNNIVKNNISVDNSSRELRCRGGGENDGTNGSGNVYLNNCLGVEANNFIEWGEGVFKDTYDLWETAYGGTTSSVEVDPQMIDPASADFRLNPHSQCVNAGTGVSLLIDYLGLLIRHAPDIGAYENQTNAIF